jgi:hypothetical protein
VNYTFTIANIYDVNEFDGKKFIYLSEVGALGGTNTFLGVIFLIFAGIVVFIMFIFCICYCVKIKGKDLYSTENMRW